MPRRSQLLGIASGVLGSFVGRNNDIGGYWALGVLYHQAQQQGSMQLELSLLPTDASLNGTLLGALAQRFGGMFVSLMTKQHLPLSWLRSATLGVQFESPNAKPRHPQSHSAERPFVCCLSFTNDLARTHELSVAGWCWPHSEQRELQSARASTNL